MNQRIFHGKITPADVARSLMAHFHRGNLRVQQIGSGDKISVQIASSAQASSGGQTALGIAIQKVEDGVSVQVGKQAWLGVAASLGYTALAALKNPLNLLSRIDDLAQDIEYMQLSDEIWKVVDQTARTLGVSHELSERFRRQVCPYCNTPNPVGEASCVACGAPLGDIQPSTCKRCGFVVTRGDPVCPNCGAAVNQTR